MVPVVIFLREGTYRRALHLGGDRHTYPSFRYLSCPLSQLPLERYLTADNLVARLNLPNMRHASTKDKLRAYAFAIRGLLELEPDPERQLKYIDFIDIYSGLDDNELADYQREYPQEAENMTTFAERFEQKGLQKGIQQGIQQGRQKGEAELLLRQLQRKFGPLSESLRQRIEGADTDTLLLWAERVLTAETLQEVFTATP